jgi:hypothetical protein
MEKVCEFGSLKYGPKDLFKINQNCLIHRRNSRHNSGSDDFGSL